MDALMKKNARIRSVIRISLLLVSVLVLCWNLLEVMCYLCEPIADTTSLSLWLASVGSKDCSLAKLLRERGGRTGGEEEETALLILSRLYGGGCLVAKGDVLPFVSRVSPGST